MVQVVKCNRIDFPNDEIGYLESTPRVKKYHCLKIKKATEPYFEVAFALEAHTTCVRVIYVHGLIYFTLRMVYKAETSL